MFQGSYCCRIGAIPAEDKLIPALQKLPGPDPAEYWSGLPFPQKEDSSPIPSEEKGLPSVAEFHRKGLEATFPKEIAEMISGDLLSGSNLKPLIFFPGSGFSHAQSQLIQCYPCLPCLPWSESSPRHHWSFHSENLPARAYDEPPILCNFLPRSC